MRRYALYRVPVLVFQCTDLVVSAPEHLSSHIELCLALFSISFPHVLSLLFPVLCLLSGLLWLCSIGTAKPKPCGSGYGELGLWGFRR